MESLFQLMQNRNTKTNKHGLSMIITYEQNLQTYMKRKGYSYIAVEAISPKGCCADSTELLTRFVRDKDVQGLKNKGCGVLKAPIGELLILTKGLEYDEHVIFGLRSFFGAKDITVKGIAPWKF